MRIRTTPTHCYTTHTHTYVAGGARDNRSQGEELHEVVRLEGGRVHQEGEGRHAVWLLVPLRVDVQEAVADGDRGRVNRRGLDPAAGIGQLAERLGVGHLCVL